MDMDTPADLPAADQKREQKLSAFLTAYRLVGQVWRHPAVSTVDESKVHCGHIPGAHLKNLVVKDKRGQTALVVVSEEKRVDLKALAARLSMGRLSFLKAEAMMALLDVEPGSVTPLAVINAPVQGEAAPLILAVDRDLWDAPMVVMHPLHNRATIGLDGGSFRAVFDHAGYGPAFRYIIDVPQVSNTVP